MSYVRSRSRRGGLGLELVFSPTSQLQAISTQQPAQQMTTIAPTVAPFAEQNAIDRTPTKRLFSGSYPVCQDPTSPKKDGWGWEEGKSCKEFPYPFCQSQNDTAGTGWGWENGKSCLVPIYKSAPAPSQPVQMTLVAPTVAPFTVEQAIATMQIASGGGSKPGAIITPPQGLPGQNSGGGDGYSQSAPGASVTPAVFAASCKQLGGKMGTNCCKLPSGASVGLNYAGQMTSVATCDSSSLSGNLPLIAAAVVGVFLLSRML